MSGIQCLLGSFDHFFYRNISNDDFYFYLRQQGCIHLNSTILLSRSFLYAAAHNLGNGHTGNSDIIHSFLQLIITGQSGDNGYFVNTSCSICCIDHSHCCVFLCFRSSHITVLTKIRVFIYIHGHGIGYIHDAESCICTRKTVLTCIQTNNLFFLANTKSDGCLNNKESQRNSDCCPCTYTDNT